MSADKYASCSNNLIDSCYGIDHVMKPRNHIRLYLKGISLFDNAKILHFLSAT